MKTKFGFTVSGKSNDVIQGFLYYFGIWEPHISHWMLSRIKNDRNRIFVDVGANIGYYSLLVARQNPYFSVLAIEAMPANFNLLETNISSNNINTIRRYCCAATSHKGKITLYNPIGMHMGAATIISGLYCNNTTLDIEGLPLSEIILPAEISRIKLFKIDVEGAEWEVIQGLIPVFDKLPEDVEFCMEITPDKLGPEKVKSIFSFFSGKGFSAYYIKNSYSAYDYITFEGYERPIRLKDKFTTDCFDVIFSREDSELL
ncbi:MAG: hypothetical protein A2X48_14290 [Lentisphaerae bacterium GWF2_49_21]|nr:MAG: hypothetical protein A2X48_14290 [Lentisphaerae bacterium GWF2_49_21]